MKYSFAKIVVATIRESSLRGLSPVTLCNEVIVEIEGADKAVLDAEGLGISYFS